MTRSRRPRTDTTKLASLRTQLAAVEGERDREREEHHDYQRRFCEEQQIAIAERARADAAEARVRELEALVNTPEVLDFVKAVQLEAAHQRARWGSGHDAGKTDADWFWLIGYLAGKALSTDVKDADSRDKKLHRIVTVAAAAANWHAAKLGRTNMRPGIETPAGEPA